MTPAEIQALWTLDLLPIEQVDAIASKWLEAGFDTPAICELAWKQSAWSDAADSFAQAIADLGLPPMTQRDAQMLLTRHTAHEVLEGRLAPLVGAHRIYWDYWASRTDYESMPEFVWELYGLLVSSDPEEYSTMTLEEIDAEIRSILAALVAVEP